MKAYQVQALDSGEMLTVVQNVSTSSGDSAQAVSMQIYHWGRQNSPPPGTPVPPMIIQASANTPVVSSVPSPAPAPHQLTPVPHTTVQKPSTTSSTPVVAGPHDHVMTFQEAGKPPQQCKVIKTYRTAQGTTAHQVQSLQTGEIFTMEDGPTSRNGSSEVVTNGEAKTISGRLRQWGQNTFNGSSSQGSSVVQTVPSSTTEPHAQTWTPSRSSTVPSTPSTTTTARTSDWSVPGNPTVQPSAASAAMSTLNSGAVAQPYTPGGAVVDRPAGMPLPTSTASAKPGPASSAAQSATAVTSTSRPGSMLAAPTSQPSMPTTPVAAAVPPPATKLVEAKPVVAAKPVETKPVEAKPVVAAKPVETKPVVEAPRTTTAKPDVAAAPAADWRQSWGKVDDHKTAPKETAPLPHANTAKPDPLADPEKYAKRTSMDTSKETGTNDKDRPSLGKPAAREGMSVMKIATGQDRPAGTLTGDKMPLGAGSVLAAGAGPNQVQYVPVPVVTVPDVRRQPEPPAARQPHLPQAPNPVAPAAYSNAFSPSQPVTSPVQTNAFAVPSSASAARPATPSMMLPARTPSVAPAAGIQPASTGSGPITQMSYNPAMDRRVNAPVQSAAFGAPPAATQNKQQLLSTLKDSLYPSQREWAAECLIQGEGQHDPAVIQALMTAARTDPAGSVRAACVRCLSKTTNTGVLELVQSLKSDTDPRVREEGERAARLLSSGPTAPVSQPIQPVGFVVPGK